MGRPPPLAKLVTKNFAQRARSTTFNCCLRARCLWGEGLGFMVQGSGVFMFLGLNYRGYNVVDLAGKATFEEVVHLLLMGDLPTRGQLTALKQKLYRARQLPPQLLTVLKQIPKEAHPMVRGKCRILGLTKGASGNNRSSR